MSSTGRLQGHEPAAGLNLGDSSDLPAQARIMGMGGQQGHEAILAIGAPLHTLNAPAMQAFFDL